MPIDRQRLLDKLKEMKEVYLTGISITIIHRKCQNTPSTGTSRGTAT